MKYIHYSLFNCFLIGLFGSNHLWKETNCNTNFRETMYKSQPYTSRSWCFFITFYLVLYQNASLAYTGLLLILETSSQPSTTATALSHKINLCCQDTCFAAIIPLWVASRIVTGAWERSEPNCAVFNNCLYSLRRAT